MKTTPYNDLPREHHQSNERPAFASGFSRPTRENNTAKKNGFATPPPMNGRLFSVYLSPEPVTILLNNPQRRALIVQNLSASDVYIGIGTPPAYDGSGYQNALLVPSGGILELASTVCTIDSIFAVTNGTSAQIAVLESTI